MKKKILALFLLVTLTILLFTGCNKIKEPEIINYPEFIILDESDVKITAKSVVKEGQNFKVNVEIINSTEDDLVFSSSIGAINGLSCSADWNQKILAGETGSGVIKFTELNNDIIKADKIQLKLLVCKAEGYADYIESKTYICYPFGEDNVELYKNVAEDTDANKEIIQGNNFNVTLVKFDKDYKDGYAIKFYVENKTDDILTFKTDKELINKCETTANGHKEVLPHCSSYFYLYWKDKEINKTVASIKAIEQITFDFLIVNNDGEEVEHRNFTVKPEYK